MYGHQSRHRTQLISFSGIDGAGKSTQIESLCDRLRQDGLRVSTIRFWDEIASLTRFRESAGHTVFKGDKGVGTPSAPINRKDKNVQSWPMTMVRLFIYFLDAISTRRAVFNALHSEDDLVIFDRYIYDELANLTLSNPVSRTYAKLIMKLVPRLQISYLLDADPEKARERKPEYPLEFLHFNRNSYLRLAGTAGLAIIAPASIQDAHTEVVRRMHQSETALLASV